MHRVPLLAARSETPAGQGAAPGGKRGHIPGHRLSAQATRRPLGRSMARGASAGAPGGAKRRRGGGSERQPPGRGASASTARPPRARLPDSRRVQRKWEGSGGGEGRGTPLGLAPRQARPLCHLGRRRAAASTPAPDPSPSPNLSLRRKPRRSASGNQLAGAYSTVPNSRVCSGKVVYISTSQSKELHKVEKEGYLRCPGT